MATIGLDRLYYAEITEDEQGEETYGTPKQLAKAISAELSVELAEATLYRNTRLLLRGRDYPGRLRHRRRRALRQYRRFYYESAQADIH